MKNLCFLIIVILFMFNVSANNVADYDLSGWTEVVKYEEDFEDHPEGSFSEIEIDGWTYEHIGGTASNISNESGNHVAKLQIHQDFYTTKPIENAYVWSFDARVTVNKIVGFIVRAHSENPYDLNYCDPDGSDIEGEPEILGFSGFSFRPVGTTMKMYVKYYDKESENLVSNEVFEFQTANFSNGPGGKLVNFTVIDDGKVASIYVDSELMATISFSDIKQYENYPGQYYSKAIIKDAEGNELGTVDNALISTRSVLVLTTRLSTIALDNLKLTEYTYEGMPELPTPEPTSTPTPSPEATNTPKIVTSSPKPTSSDKGNIDESGDRDSTMLITIGVIIGIVVIGAVVFVVILKKK
jgi:hypothetical protein